jgi:regulator of replication initiation timing
MSYIDNTKGNMMKEIYILELENEMLRKQITKLKIELNELLDSTQRTEAADDKERKATIG